MLYQPACHTAPKREMSTLGDQGMATLSGTSDASKTRLGLIGNFNAEAFFATLLYSGGNTKCSARV
jgi:hypothetical protein